MEQEKREREKVRERERINRITNEHPSHTCRESWSDAQVRVVAEGRFGNVPRAEQGGRCGVPGSRVEVPVQFAQDLTIQARYGSAGNSVAYIIAYIILSCTCTLLLTFSYHALAIIFR